MSRLNNESFLFYVDALKRDNCRILMDILNNYWSAAAFDRHGLDYEKIQYLIRRVKTNGLALQTMCQNQPNYIPWTKISSKKRKFNKCSEGRSEKRIRNM